MSYVKFRASEDEKKLLAERAKEAGLSVSDLCRTSLANPPKRSRKPRQVTADPELIRQVARIGNNLNQLARLIHSADLVPSDGVRLLALLSEMNTNIKDLTIVSIDAP